MAQMACSASWVVCSIAQTLVSTPWLLVKLVRSLLLMVSNKLHNSDKLNAALLNGYKALED